MQIVCVCVCMHVCMHACVCICVLIVVLLICAQIYMHIKKYVAWIHEGCVWECVGFYAREKDRFMGVHVS